MLDAKELAQLKRLQEKLKESEPQLTEANLQEMENRVTAAYDGGPDRMRTIFIEPWNAHCELMRNLARDNARLIAEVRKLNEQIVALPQEAKK